MSDTARLRQGTVNQETGLVFWSYDQNKKERWLTKEKFAESREKARANAKKRYWSDVDASRARLREWHHDNRDKKALNFKKWSENNKSKIRDGRLLRSYGVTSGDYISMFESQIGLCAICGEQQQGITKNGEIPFLCVDHCHRTGKVRELLCVKCNAGLGQFRDNPDFLKRAAEYLIKHQTQGMEQ